MVDDKLKKQSIRGEVEYRKRLVRQQVLGVEHHFADHKSSLDEVYDSWMRPQIKKLDGLLEEVFRVGRPSFFLEVGSENSHLGLHLKNSYGIDGVCVDLSFDTLRQGVPKVSKKLGAEESPFLVVADTHDLPFRENSFDFVFCFGSLHHFYDLEDAVKEIRGALRGGGVFLTSYDPLKPFFRPAPKETCSELSYGVLENTYNLWEYTSGLKKSFSEVRVIYPKSSDRIDLLYKIRRLRRSRISSVIQKLIPKKAVHIMRILWFGMEDFSSISVA